MLLAFAIINIYILLLRHDDVRLQTQQSYVVMVPVTETELIEKLEQEKNKNAYILQALKICQEKKLKKFYIRSI